MSNRTVMTGLIIMIALQFTVLMAEYCGAVYPLLTGTEIRLKTLPFDPRSMFRGNYARLQYDISSIDRKALDGAEVRSGEVVYVKLRPGPDGVYEFDGASMDKPGSGVFIRGRIRNAGWAGNYSVTYGIEAMFAPKEKALALQKDMRRGGHAVVMVSGTGRAALKEVVPDPEKNPPPIP